jgi:hypothetical protein
MIKSEFAEGNVKLPPYNAVHNLCNPGFDFASVVESGEDGWAELDFACTKLRSAISLARSSSTTTEREAGDRVRFSNRALPARHGRANIRPSIWPKLLGKHTENDRGAAAAQRRTRLDNESSA